MCIDIVLGLLVGKFHQFSTDFCFQMITSVNINEFSPNLLCALILYRSASGKLMAKFINF